MVTNELLRTKKKHKRQRIFLAMLFILPATILIYFFSYYLAGQSMLYSLFDYDYRNPPGIFVGLDNYIALFKSEVFWRQVRNTISMFLWGMAFGFFTPILQALLLNETQGKLRGVLRYLYLIPTALPTVAMSAIWRYIWDPDAGLANQILSLFHIAPKSWLYDENLIRMTLNIPTLMGGGMQMLIYLVAIEGIDMEIYESAILDGASRFKRLIYITIPNMSFMIKLQFLLSMTHCLTVFDTPYIMTDGSGGPNKAAETIVFGIYNRAFDSLQYGTAMATSVVLMVFTAIILLIKNVIEKRAGRGNEG